MATAPDGRVIPGPDRHLMVTSRLRDRRHTLGLTQKQVVTRLVSLGVSSTNKSLSSLEHGAGIDVGKLPELAAALECTVTYLLGLTDDPRSWQPDGSARWRTRPPRVRPSRAVPDPPPAVSDAADAGWAPAGLADNEDDRHAGWILGPYGQDPGPGRFLRPDR